MDTKITDIKAVQIADSRGNPTLSVSVHVGETVGTFLVPSGASTGKYEAHELRDYASGKGTMKNAINAIETKIKLTLIGMDVMDQSSIDMAMIALDGTPQKKVLGGNSTIGVSIACAKAAAKVKGVEVFEYLRTIADMKPSHKNPWLYFNLINGGKHASSRLAFQEYHIVPQASTISENVEIAREVQKKLDEVIIQKFGKLSEKGDEGGVALSVGDVMEPLYLLKIAVDMMGYTDKVMFALDVASSSFYDEEKKVYTFMSRDWTSDDMIELYKNITSSYPIISIEDPFDEEDYASFAKLQGLLPDVKIIGDDLTVTNIERLAKAIDEKSIEGIIIKPNQIGTLTETLNTMELARRNGIDCIVSHRSGETMDDFIADLAYAFGCFGIKAGALGPKERDVKYERLIKITN